MAKLTKKRSRKAGLPPGTLVHIGEKLTEKTRIAVVEYDGKDFLEKEPGTLETCYLFPKEPAVTWSNVIGIHQVEVLEKLGNRFGVHPLALEDIVNTEQRPKIEDYGDDLFIVVKLLSSNEERDEIEAEQISLILRPDVIISFQEKEGDDFSTVKERLRAGKGRLRKMGADYLAYTLLDIVVDQYFVVLEKLGERLEVLEERLLADPGTATLQKIQNLKKEMLLLRKWIWPPAGSHQQPGTGGVPRNSREHPDLPAGCLRPYHPGHGNHRNLPRHALWDARYLSSPASITG